ncbi:hypothetical protein EYC80_003837 [Monilinia laxa]|uniref:Dynein light chain n=3 Tax=Monilinia TaxID=38447 RepID=A0A5N6KLE1_MONLA|nr:hypothetical protein EYC80_003837 [Monilinia laxa]
MGILFLYGKFKTSTSLDTYLANAYLLGNKDKDKDKEEQSPIFRDNFTNPNKYLHYTFRKFNTHRTYTIQTRKKKRMAAPPQQVEEALVAQIKSVDMSDDMSDEAIEVCRQAMAKHSVEKDIAQYVKKAFDEKRGPTWHCIVGRNFGSFVTHETKHFIYFYLGHCAILLFKTQ